MTSGGSVKIRRCTCWGWGVDGEDDKSSRHRAGDFRRLISSMAGSDGLFFFLRLPWAVLAVLRLTLLMPMLVLLLLRALGWEDNPSTLKARVLE